MGERWEIRRGLVGGRSLRAIAVVLGRPVSTVAREVDRNGGPEVYRARAAQAQAEQRAKRPKVGRFESDPGLAAQVEALLAARWSPQQVARRLRKDHPGDPRWVVSAQTIYRSLFVQGRGGLRVELRASLRGKRARRRPAQDGRGRLPGMVLISERPAEAEDRAVPGHWEGDLVLGGDRRSALVTLVERSSRYVLLGALRDNHTAEAALTVLTMLVRSLPAHLARSLTWDQGKEMARHAQFSIDTGVQVYFCDPGKPWQRGSNENTNGLLRQYFPKGSTFTSLTEDHLQAVAAELNGRPRMTLDWDTPAEVYARAVAMTP